MRGLVSLNPNFIFHPYIRFEFDAFRLLYTSPVFSPDILPDVRCSSTSMLYIVYISALESITFTYSSSWAHLHRAIPADVYTFHYTQRKRRNTLIRDVVIHCPFVFAAYLKLRNH